MNQPITPADVQRGMFGDDFPCCAPVAGPVPVTDGRRDSVERATRMRTEYDQLLDLGCGDEVQTASLIADLLMLAQGHGWDTDGLLDLARHHIVLADEDGALVPEPPC